MFYPRPSNFFVQSCLNWAIQHSYFLGCISTFISSGTFLLCIQVWIYIRRTHWAYVYRSGVTKHNALLMKLWTVGFLSLYTFGLAPLGQHIYYVIYLHYCFLNSPRYSGLLKYITTHYNALYCKHLSWQKGIQSLSYEELSYDPQSTELFHDKSYQWYTIRIHNWNIEKEQFQRTKDTRHQIGMVLKTAQLDQLDKDRVFLG